MPKSMLNNASDFFGLFPYQFSFFATVPRTSQILCILDNHRSSSTIIDGNGMRPESGVLRIDRSVVSISGVTIRNGGLAHNHGGGILNNGTLTLTGSIVSGNGNSGGALGGGINNGGN